MKIQHRLLVILLGLVLTSLMWLSAPQPVYAKVCHDAVGNVVPCEKSNRQQPTEVPPTFTPTVAPTLTATTEAVIPPAGGGNPANPGGQLPAIQNPNPGPSPSTNGNGGPGPLGMIFAGLIIVVCFGGGLFFIRRRFTGDNAAPQPHMDNSIGNPDWNAGAPSAQNPGQGASDGIGGGGGSGGGSGPNTPKNPGQGASDGIGGGGGSGGGSGPNTPKNPNPDWNAGTPSEQAPGNPDMPGSNQAIDFRMKGSPNNAANQFQKADNQFQKADNQFMKSEGNQGPGEAGGEQIN